MTDGPTVIYLAGFGRSGSTLLERALGEIAGFVNVGELIDLFRRCGPQDERCGCGLPFTACPFWAGVGAHAFGGWSEDTFRATGELQRQVARQRHLPRLLAPHQAGPRFQAALAAYGDRYRRLYQAIAAQAGAGWVVDASKWPVQALALARAGLDLRVIHLTRDVRGVAHSLSKNGIARPHAASGTDVMWHLPPASAAARWLACESAAGLLPRCGLAVARMRYEDFTAAPRECAAGALGTLGVPVPAGGLGHLRDGHITLGTSHGLSGNPARFAAGDIAVRADDAWRSQMAWRDRAVVTAIGLPGLLRAGPRRPAAWQRGAAGARAGGGGDGAREPQGSPRSRT
jgi:Sulfotransferase family